jgi:DUF1680 family protein
MNFKEVTFYFLIIAICCLSCQHKEVEKQEKNMTLTPVRFIFDDDLSYAGPGFDHSNWPTIDTLLEGKFQNFDKKIAWFRANFHLPEAWKETTGENEYFQVYVGRIGENDQVFLNGQLIGQNAENVSIQDADKVPDFYPVVGKYYPIRRYYLPVEDKRINWGGNNILAIRIGNAPGIPFISSKGISAGVMPLLIKNKTANFKKDEVNIYDFWKFRLDDKQNYASPGYDDTGWDSVVVRLPYTWQGFDSTGNAWYRKKVHIPSSIKKFSDIKSHLRFQVGEFSNSGEFFLNGKNMEKYKIKNYLNTYDIPLHNPSIMWNKENLLAVRTIDNPEAPNVHWKGIVKHFYETRHTFYIKSPSSIDYLELSVPDKLPDKASKGRPIPVILTAKNTAQIPLTAEVSWKITRKRDNREIAGKKQTVHLGAGEEKQISQEFSPEMPDNYLLTYSIRGTNEIKKERSKILAYLDPGMKDFTKNVEYNVALKIEDVSQPVPNHQLNIKGLIGRRIDYNFSEGLMKLHEKKLLEGFYHRPGKTTPIGEFIGKYMVGQMKMLHYNNDPGLKEKINREIGILIASQQKDGYLGTFNYHDRWTTWDVWVHKYVLLALVHYYELTAYEPALEAAEKIGDFLCKHLGDAPNQNDIINVGPFNGMPSTSVILPMTYLYQFSGKQKYADFCEYIIKAYDQKNGSKLLTTLLETGKTNEAGGGKAYEQMSNLIGILRLYQITGNDNYLKALNMAWEDILNKRLYITGSGSYHEFWHEAHDFPGTREFNPCEGCVTVHWLFMNRVLFNLTGHQRYIDEIEKSMYNHLFAAESPHTCGISYYTVLEGKRFYNQDQTICCNSSVLREMGRLPESMYARTKKDELAILLYSQGSFYDHFQGNKKVTFSINTDYPKSGKVVITVEPEKITNFSLKLRVPGWTNKFLAKTANNSYEGIPGEFLTIKKKWEGKETISISMDMNPKLLKGKKRYPGYFALKYGPQILAVDNLVNPGIDPDKISLTKEDDISIKPYIGEMPESWAGNQAFISNVVYSGKNKPVILVPFADAGQFGNEYIVWIKGR